MAATKTKPTKEDEDLAFCDYLVGVRAEADAWLDAKAAEMKKEFPTIPLGVHKLHLTNRAVFGYCPCAAVLMANPIPEQDA